MPQMVVLKPWETRSLLRYGSRHEGYFETEVQARASAEADIKATGGQGKITSVVEKVVYFSTTDDDDKGAALRKCCAQRAITLSELVGFTSAGAK